LSVPEVSDGTPGVWQPLANRNVVVPQS